MTATIWPPIHAYALAHRCPICHAEPGQPCNAPSKNARADRFGGDQVSRMHAARRDTGAAHYSRDIGNAPWAEDREPGPRCDTLGAAWTPDADA